jgi:hypothetical protein
LLEAQISTILEGVTIQPHSAVRITEGATLVLEEEQIATIRTFLATLRIIDATSVHRRDNMDVA